MNIAGREINGSQPPYLIAEVSCNHCGDFDKALALIRAAKDAGADACKFQAYTPDTITIDCDKPDFIMREGPWKGRKLYELYQKAHTPFRWFPDLFGAAAECGITAFASVFDRTSVDALEKLDCPAYKIASMEITDIPLIKYAAKTGKPLIISTGMANENEIVAAGTATNPNQDVAFLACTSGYPAPVSESGLCKFKRLYDKYGVYGISDHSLGLDVAVAATAMGAQIIEKHLCLSRQDPTEDAAFSMEPLEFKRMCEVVRSIWQAMQPSKAQSEEPQRQARRSLYVVEDIKAGEPFTERNVRSIRPGYGMAPKELPNVLGRYASRNIERGSRLELDMIWTSAAKIS